MKSIAKNDNARFERFDKSNFCVISPLEIFLENALPVDNRSLGAMVPGYVGTSTLWLDDHTVWCGSSNSNENTDAPGSLPEIRKLIFAGR